VRWYGNGGTSLGGAAACSLLIICWYTKKKALFITSCDRALTYRSIIRPCAFNVRSTCSQGQDKAEQQTDSGRLCRQGAPKDKTRQSSKQAEEPSPQATPPPSAAPRPLTHCA
jgi:hypothetical protein